MSIVFSDFESIKRISSQGIEYWSARDVRNLLAYTEWRSFEDTLKQAMRTCKLAKQEVKYHFVAIQKRIEQGRAYRNIVDYMLTRYALYLLLTHCDPQKPEIALFLAYLVHNTLEVGYHYTVFAQEVGTFFIDNVALSKEQETVGQITRAFQHHAAIKQYRVGGYFIDLYFPEFCIAVECDEYGHVNYSPKEEYQRQKYIEDALGCRFIRYNPDDKNFNVGDVIHKIMLLIYY